MIDDKIEEGLTEEEAIKSIEFIDEISQETTTDDLFEEKPKQKLTGYETTLLVLGSPIWIGILIIAGSLIFTFYAVYWVLIAVLWVIELPFLIFALISKYLLPVCTRVTELSYEFTKKSINAIKNKLKRK